MLTPEDLYIKENKKRVKSVSIERVFRKKAKNEENVVNVVVNNIDGMLFQQHKNSFLVLKDQFNSMEKMLVDKEMSEDYLYKTINLMKQRIEIVYVDIIKIIILKAFINSLVVFNH